METTSYDKNSLSQTTLFADELGKISQRSRSTKKEKKVPNNLAKAVKSRVPDFNSQQRAQTCLEVNFPIVPINRLAQQEGNAGKPIYQMSKWWARRRSSVFRSMLLAAATQTPENEDSAAAARQIWDAYYANHQKGGSFKHLRVLDPFMGGGTTLVEGARLGMQMYGMDLNPVAWLVVKNELACSDPDQIRDFFRHVEAEARPQIQPFYTTSCPRGHRGQWIDTRIDKPAAIDPIRLSPEERMHYRWQGPEVVYTFWAKHCPCPALDCGHRTPIFKTLLIAEKKLTTNYLALHCPSCSLDFDAELGATRMAPDAPRVVLSGEKPFTETSQPFAQHLQNYEKGTQQERQARPASLQAMIPAETALCCPHCGAFAGQAILDVVNKHAQRSVLKKKDLNIRRKTVRMQLLLHPDWLQGSPGSVDGTLLGGFVGANHEASAAWYRLCMENLSLIEVRGYAKPGSEGVAQNHLAEEVGNLGDSIENASAEEAEVGNEQSIGENGLPRVIVLPDGASVDIDSGTVPAQSTCSCMACGRANDLLTAMKASEQTAPTMAYALQCYCPTCEAGGYNYGGRFFKAPDADDIARLVAADAEWSKRSQEDLSIFWPREPLPYAHMTHHLNGGIPNWGYTHWWKMFNPRQLLVHATLLRSITTADPESWSLDIREQALGAFQQYLRNQNMFCFWDFGYDKLVPSLSNANFHPKPLIVENCVFHELGRGNWVSTLDKVVEGIAWRQNPWESFLPVDMNKAEKLFPGDGINEERSYVYCGSSTELPMENGTMDMVITDPPFGDNVFYADLADFFYVWLRIPMLRWYANQPQAEYFRLPATPKALEVITNRAEHPDTRSSDDKRAGGKSPADEFYQEALTACWAEANRVLKPGGTLTFTFHHSEDGPWINVLESLFEAGFMLVATYPIRSDESKGTNAQFGSKKIEYDIIHVCRKRLDTSDTVYWASMRAWVRNEATNLRRMLEAYHKEELPEADILVILRGKALEYYSRYYGRVMTASHELLSIRNALININLLLDDLEPGDGIRPPDIDDGITRLFLSIFAERSTLPRDELHKRLRGDIVESKEFLDRGWLKEGPNKSVVVTPIVERFKELRKPGRRRDTIKHNLDQAHFFIGAALPGSGIEIQSVLLERKIPLHDDIEVLLDWYVTNNSEKAMRDAAALAQRLISAWRTSSKEKPKEQQMSLFEESI